MSGVTMTKPRQLTALAVLPYLVVIFVLTVVIAFVPGIALFLPRLMMGGM